MRNLKRTLSLALAAVMLMGMMVVGAGAASKDFTDAGEIDNVEAVDVMVALGVLEGGDKGDFQPNSILTREQAAKIICYMLLGPDNAEKLATSGAVFSDVAADRWSAPYIGYCVNLGILAGDGNGHFFPEGKLTGAAFGKMLLVALGYNANTEKYVGDSWTINVATGALNAGILPDGLVLTDELSRQDAAQMALMTLEATMVEYKTAGSSVVLPDGTQIITSGASASKVENSDEASDTYNDTADGFTQFCEKYFPKLNKQEAGDGDSFGRPAIEWSLDGESDAIGVYAEAADYTVVATKVEDVAYWAEKANKKLTFNADTDFKDNGVTAGSSAAALGAGDIVELYVGDNNVIENVVVIRYTTDVITDVDTDVSDDDAEDGVTAYVTFEKAGTFNNTEVAGYIADTYVEDAVVALVEGDKEIIGSYVCDSVEGAITAYTSTTYTVDGTKYTKAAGIDDAIASVDFDEGSYKLYLDANGYVVKTEVVEGSVNVDDVFHIASTWTEESKAYNENTTTFYAQIVYLDGTVEEVELAQADGLVNTATSDAKKVSEKITAIMTDEVFFTSTKTKVAGTDDVSVALSAWDNSDTDYKIGAIDFNDNDKIKTDATKVKDFYVNSKTVYVVVEGSGSKLSVTTKTGGLSFTAKDTDVANVIYTTENGSKVANYVVIITTEYNTAATSDYFYVADSTDYVNVSGGKEYTVYGMDGKETTIVIDKDETVDGETFYNFTEKDGVYSDLVAVSGQKDKAVYTSYYGDLLTATDGITDYDASNAVIVDAHDTDDYNKSVTTLAAMQTAKKAGYIVTFDAIVDAEDEEVDYIVVTSVKSKSASAIDDVQDYKFVGNLVVDGNNVSVSANAAYCTGDSNNDGSNDVTGDLARFLGSLYSKGAREIKFAGKTYTWIVDNSNGAPELTGSNWRTGTTGNYTTLVKAIVTNTWGGSDNMTTGPYKAALTVDGVVMNYTVTVG